MSSGDRPPGAGVDAAALPIHKQLDRVLCAISPIGASASMEPVCSALGTSAQLGRCVTNILSGVRSSMRHPVSQNSGASSRDAGTSKQGSTGIPSGAGLAPSAPLSSIIDGGTQKHGGLLSQSPKPTSSVTVSDDVILQ